MNFKHVKAINSIRERLMFAGIPTDCMVIVRDTIEVDREDVRKLPKRVVDGIDAAIRDGFADLIVTGRVSAITFGLRPAEPVHKPQRFQHRPATGGLLWDIIPWGSAWFDADTWATIEAELGGRHEFVAVSPYDSRTWGAATIEAAQAIIDREDRDGDLPA